ncbi:protein LTV1 homolog [Aplysia californica]|uniref:Protein LTV1 homolog n=1 Tax=Aplysia californica TaxID=6500 RepID=A0ABM0K3F4_APLCA|nr:protein LTV1 homolog [Aplysia californica]
MPKPVRKKKHFIRKKESTTYRLIPGYVDDEDEGTKPCGEELEKRKEEQREFGIFYDDEYNYMKHLRSVNEQATLVSTESYHIDPEDEVRSHASMPFPFKEFFSTDETEEEKIDPEILAALEEAPVVAIDGDDVDVDEGGAGFLDDDFIVKAGGMAPQERETGGDGEFDMDDREFDFDDEDEEEEDDDNEDVDSEFSDRVSDISLEDDDRLGTRKRQGRGTEQDDIIEAQTALILRNFEEGIGFRCSAQNLSDDEQEMPTAEDYERLKHIIGQDELKPKVTSWAEVLDDKSEKPKIDSSKYLYEDEDEYEWKEVPPSKPKYDCVSILSLRSNTKNLPTDLIPPLKAKTKKKQLQQSDGESTTSAAPGLSLRQLEEEMRESRRADKASTFRPEDETAEEKRARKKAVKDERKERRQEKKANKMVFSQEKSKMKVESAALSKAVKSIKLT